MRVILVFGYLFDPLLLWQSDATCGWVLRWRNYFDDRLKVVSFNEGVFVKQLLEKILTENSDVLEDPAPNVIFEDFGDSALIFDAFFWIETTSERSLRGVRSELRFTVDKVFKENNIVIAFPQRDIHVDGTLKIER